MSKARAAQSGQSDGAGGSGERRGREDIFCCFRLSERQFEKFCETCVAVDWIYKNGDKGDEYLSVVYNDNSGAQKLFYPDYVLSVRGETWIVETKGGFTRGGKSEDIDIFSPKKFEVLKAYLDKHGLKGGFVRYDKQSEELCVCIDNYSDDIRSDGWEILKELWG